MLRYLPTKAVSRCSRCIFNSEKPCLTEPENIERGVPGLETDCKSLELGPFSRGEGV